MHTSARIAATAVRIVATAVALAVVASACGGGDESSDGGTTVVSEESGTNVRIDDGPGVPGGSLRYGLYAETDGWNPSSSRWAASGLEVAGALFDTLAAYDADGGWQPFLAESLTPNEDATVWTVTVREGVTFHDGSPVDGEALKANIDFHLASPLTKAAFEPVTGTEVVGPRSIEVTMRESWVNWPYALATQVGVIAEPGWLASGDTRAPVGTGPFVLDSWEPDKELVATRNDDYWRDGLPYLDEVRFLPIIEAESRAQAFDAGDIDIMLTSDPRQITDYSAEAEDGEVQVFRSSDGETPEQFVQLNVSAPPFDDPAARRLLALATDNQALVDTLFDGLPTPASGPFPTDSPWFVETDYPTYDPDAAREAAEAYEAANGGPLSFTLLSAPDTKDEQAAQLLAQSWAEVGIDAEVRVTQQAELILQVLTGNYQSSLWAQFDSPHPLGDTVWWHPKNVNPVGTPSLNFARNVDEEIGTALDRARQVTDPAEERAIYATVQERLAATLPYIWLYHEEVAVVARDSLVNVTNWTLPDGAPGLPLRQGSHPVAQIWIDQG